MDTFTFKRCYSAAGVKATTKYGKEKMSVWRPEKEAMRRQDHDTSRFVNHNFLSGLQEGAETFLYFLSFFFPRTNTSPWQQSHSSIKIMPACQRRRGCTLCSLALILARCAPRNETPAKFILKERGHKDRVKECAKKNGGEREAVKKLSGTPRGPKLCWSSSLSVCWGMLGMILKDHLLYVPLVHYHSEIRLTLCFSDVTRKELCVLKVR